jgi:hypothetical protein
MSAEKGTLFKRLRGALSPPVVAPQAEYVRHTTDERTELMARIFGVQPEEEEEEEAASTAEPAAGHR